jgi:hypothetical protein
MRDAAAGIRAIAAAIGSADAAAVNETGASAWFDGGAGQCGGTGLRK